VAGLLHRLRLAAHRPESGPFPVIAGFRWVHSYVIASHGFP